MQDRSLRCTSRQGNKKYTPSMAIFRNPGIISQSQLHARAVWWGHRAPALAEKSPAKKSPADLSLCQLPHTCQKSKATTCILSENLSSSHRSHHCASCYKTMHQAGAAPCWPLATPRGFPQAFPAWKASWILSDFAGVEDERAALVA